MTPPEPSSELELLFTEADLLPAAGSQAPLNAGAAAGAAGDLASSVIQADIDLSFSEADLMAPAEKQEDGKKTVLLVDDDPDIVEILRVRLEGAGFVCRTASNGPEALGLLQSVTSGRPDIAVVDMLMPGMDGYEVCRQMRMQFSENPFPILMVSEKADTESVVRALDLGAADFLRKPVDAQELLARMKTTLQIRDDLRRARAQIKELTHINSTLVRSNAKLAATTVVDELTGLTNRGHFIERLHHQVAVARRMDMPLSLGLLRFRTMTGGAVSDQGLPGLARQLLDMARPTDLCARIEPVMFAVLMPATDSKDSGKIIPTWRRQLGQSLGNPKSVDVVTGVLKADESAIEFLDRLEYGQWPE
ncbi:MAG: hypothetical protein A3G34_05390 [Candidatus Lindowbacteria bacterium RIFCSPLOWO2_12_FULL_62_27]|nr:MAG: hypothetical protein A3G34_05390 [Candidatus Lindowbacteria bacterium RIFCSPLOWO2_12_FULL_62_27]OGH63929.1 MAG: hypothetical protein A3I06_03815 [Candidatus Lindowbacteria bacterium RIFCSPLOWO2_02_FULL_62_12]